MAQSDNIQNDINSLQNQYNMENDAVIKLDNQIQDLTNQANQRRQKAATLQDQIMNKTSQLQSARQQEAAELKRQADEAMKQANNLSS